MAQDAEKLAAQAERLRALKKIARGVTFKDIADAAGVTERQAQRWFAGDGDIGPASLKKLAKFFGTTQDYIEYGRLQRGVPDPFAGDPVRAQLTRIEIALSDLVDRLVGAGLLAAVDKDAATKPPSAPSKRRKPAA